MEAVVSGASPELGQELSTFENIVRFQRSLRGFRELIGQVVGLQLAVFRLWLKACSSDKFLDYPSGIEAVKLGRIQGQ